MKKFKRILKFIFTLGISFLLEYQDKKRKKEIDSLIQGINHVVNGFKDVSTMYKDGKLKPEDVLYYLRPSSIKDTIWQAQEMYGTAESITKRINELIEQNEFRKIRNEDL